MNDFVPHGPVLPTADAISALRPLPASGVRLSTEGLLGGWQERNATATLPHCVTQLDRHGNLANLRRVTGDRSDVAFRGFWFADTDVHKTLEAAFWEQGRSGTASPFTVDAAALLEKAQDPDGYLDSYYQVENRDKQWTELHFSHEMYTAGHLIQAAVAAARTAPGDAAAQQVLTVARRFADLLVTRYGDSPEVDGHPEIETALVELYRVTGHRPYLDLAGRFVDNRGHGVLGEGRFGPRYFQDHEPLRSAAEVTGHVVRQLYLLAGAVDVAVETGDRELLDAVVRLWDSAQNSRTYVTGGQGSRHRDEAFGDPYELPPDRAYAETCAAIGSFQLAWRLLLATGEARYADEMERVLLNGIAGSTSVDGTAFFYSNPLHLRTGHDGSHEDAPTQRLSWYSCACCPPNLARLMASLHGYVATGSAGDGLQLHLYGPGTVAGGGHEVTVDTRYPWDEQITVTVSSASDTPWTLAMRVPAWCDAPRLIVNGTQAPARGQIQDGYLRLHRSWKPGDTVVLTLTMPSRLVAAHPRVDASRGAVALARGPLVYCLEQADVPADHDVEDLALDPAAPLAVSYHSGGLSPVTLRVPMRVRSSNFVPLYSDISSFKTTAATVTAIPYFLWANRSPGAMRVWIPLATREE
ncbi:glycoside hydrolase family 127 protein [Actinoplanes rectilineatus]|uniref:glycoside hydrolase family 127 protein n=1 Tax=Actinoplanes rectilineatus TaxID=113571 RepID=UPI0005F28BD3|nr:beta-L-arabinofuranosidase domain-containing protein [Actinoplanes rectilineatus]